MGEIISAQILWTKFNGYNVTRRLDTLNYNVTSFIGYVNNTVIKPSIYFNSHMRIGKQIKNIIPKGIHVFIQDHGTCKPKTFLVLTWVKLFQRKFCGQNSTDIMLPMLKC
jgi:hypothetical protein